MKSFVPVSYGFLGPAEFIILYLYIYGYVYIHIYVSTPSQHLNDILKKHIGDPSRAVDLTRSFSINALRKLKADKTAELIPKST